jgi:hypothetical protein
MCEIIKNIFTYSLIVSKNSNKQSFFTNFQWCGKKQHEIWTTNQNTWTFWWYNLWPNLCRHGLHVHVLNVKSDKINYLYKGCDHTCTVSFSINLILSFSRRIWWAFPTNIEPGRPGHPRSLNWLHTAGWPRANFHSKLI